ncbi:solute carrier organic anion transporter family member 1C1-like [Discoglossus pictus]
MAVDKDTNDSSDSNYLNLSTKDPKSTQEGKKTVKKTPGCANLKMFIVALCFTYFAKAFSGSYMKSSITQIERRFDIPSSIAGIIDGSFEFGNLLVIAVVSYFGAKLHRPRIIAAGCLVMSLGSFLTAMPHFFMGPYKYETSLRNQVFQSNESVEVSPCSANQTFSEYDKNNCEKESGSYMWLFMLAGNTLRGIGETPITPLGISYIDDFSMPENTPLYIASVHTVAIFGPMLGFIFGSFCARLYVDIGFVDLEKITITPQDTRWVGAWWLGFLVAGLVNLLSGIPFCFLPKSLSTTEEQAGGTSESCPVNIEKDEKTKMKSKQHEKPTVKGFFRALKALGSNRLYVMLMVLTLLQVNSFIGFITYKPKYIEQQYGQSTSTSNFTTGVSSLPAAALGMFLGGLLMKKYKFGLLGAAKLSFGTSLVACLLSLSVFMIGCDNNDVAGITVRYDGSKQDTFKDNALYSSCNGDCSCSLNQWDPVCGDNNITYMSACLAGCTSSTGTGKRKMYHNCTCIGATGFQPSNLTAALGVCPRSDDCPRMFLYYIISQVITTFIFALGAASGYILLLWSVSPELKALAVGVYMFLIRALAGITAPIYFGALIDRTCLKWGTRSCGGRGACRMYDTYSFRNTFLGLTAGIRAPSFILFIIYIAMVKKHIATGVIKPSEQEQKEDGVKKDIYTKCAPDELSTEKGTEKDTEKESCI